MSVQDVGVRLVADGSAGYINALTDASKVTTNFTNAVAGVSNPVAGMGFAAMAAAQAVGNLASQALTAGYQKIMEFSEGAINAAASLQDLKLSLQTMAATEIKAAGGTDDLNKAFEMAAPLADNLMGKIRDLSMKSPFEYQDIMKVFQLNQAFGQTIDISLRLTKAITDISAAKPGIPGMMERVAYNFSQMSNTSQITERDLRDLRLAGVDMAEVLESQLGKSIKQVNDELKTGQMVFADVSEAFVKYAEENFGGAADRMSKTFTGLKSSFNDLVYFSSIDIFGKPIDRFVVAMNKVFTSVRSFVDSGELLKIGAVLDIALEQIINFSESAINWIRDIWTDYGAEIKQTAWDAFNWGIEVTAELAAGIAEGASTALIGAMDYISGLLEYWIKPNSPPRIAPDIDIWGAMTMTEYLKGFKEADFSVIGQVGNIMENALSTLVDAGEIGKTDQFDILGGLYESMIKGISAGDFSGLVTKLRDQLGPLGAQIGIMVDKQQSLKMATDAVAKAQERLVAANNLIEVSSNQMIVSMDEYNRLAKAGASKEVLAAKKKDFELAKAKRAVAVQEAIAAQSDLDLSSESAKKLEGEVRLQTELAQTIMKLMGIRNSDAKAEADAVKQAEKAAEKIEKARETTTKEEKRKEEKPEVIPPEALKPAMPDLGGPISNKFEEIRKIIFEKLKTAFDPLATAWDERITPAIDRVIKKFNDEFWPHLEEKWPSINEKLEKFNTLVGDAQKVVDAWSPTLLSIAGWFTDIDSGMGSVIKQITNTIWTEFDKQLQFTHELLMMLNGEWWTWDNFVNFMTTDRFPKFLTSFLELIPAVKMVNTVIGSMRWALEEIVKWAGLDWLPGMDDIFMGVIKALKQAFTDLGEMQSWIMDQFGTLGSAIIDGIIIGITGGAGSLFTALKNLAYQALIEGKNAIGSHSPSKLFSKEMGTPISTGIAMGIASGMPAVEKAMKMVASPNIRSSSADARVAGYRAAVSNSYAQSTHYNLTLNSSMAPTTVKQGFDVIKALAL